MKPDITKREVCRNFVKTEDWKSAFKLAQGFDALFTKSEIEKISIAYECLTGKEGFYKMLKYDVDAIKVDAQKILKTYVENYNPKV
jgi:hypothetical protein